MECPLIFIISQHFRGASPGICIQDQVHSQGQLRPGPALDLVRSPRRASEVKIFQWLSGKSVQVPQCWHLAQINKNYQLQLFRYLQYALQESQTTDVLLWPVWRYRPQGPPGDLKNKPTSCYECSCCDHKHRK